MKSISVTFTDEEHSALLKAKANMSWHDFILNLARAFSGRHGVSISPSPTEKLAGRKFSSPEEAHRWLGDLEKEGEE